MVDRTLNEWSEWQLKNLNAIVWLYRGQTEKYADLIQQYKDAVYQYTYSSTDRELDDILFRYSDFASLAESLKTYLASKRQRAKECIENCEKRKKKAEQAKWDEYLAWIEEIIGVAAEANWLYEKFGEGEYRDIPGLCKVASRAEIAEKNYSLTPGAYVGVAAVEDDGVDFALRMGEIHRELLDLQAESNELMQTISKNLKEMGL